MNENGAYWINVRVFLGSSPYSLGLEEVFSHSLPLP